MQMLRSGAADCCCYDNDHVATVGQEHVLPWAHAERPAYGTCRAAFLSQQDAEYFEAKKSRRGGGRGGNGGGDGAGLGYNGAGNGAGNGGGSSRPLSALPGNELDEGTITDSDIASMGGEPQIPHL